MSGVSVVIAATRPQLLPRAVASARAQTSPPVEVLVEEDPERRGPAGPRNRGAARARGEFLAFLDDDDAWHPSFLERVRVPDGCVLAYSALPHLPAQDPRQGSPTVPSAAVIRADAFRAVGGFRAFPIAEDYDLFLRLRRLGPFHRVDDPLVEYTRHESPERFLELRVWTIAVLETLRAEHPSEFDRRTRRNLAREYRLLATALRRRRNLSRYWRRILVRAAAESLRLRPHLRAVQALAWGVLTRR